MYSNALRQNPLFKPKTAYKQGIDEHSVGTVTKPCHWDTIPKQAHRTKYAHQRKRVFATTQSTVEKHHTPANYELDATLQHRQFEKINDNRGFCHEKDGKLHIGRVFSIPSVMQNNVTVETNKPRIIKEHVGGSTEYPTTAIGEALLKQKALTSLVKTFPESLSKLNGKLSELLSIGTDSEPLHTPPKGDQPNNSPHEPPVQDSGYETSNEGDDMDIETDEQDDDSKTEDDKTEGYRGLLTKLQRILSRIIRNRDKEIDANALEFLREIDVITDNDMERSTIIEKIKSAIAQIEVYITKHDTLDEK